MARFVFKLEGVLRQRKQVEQEKQRDLAERQRHLVSIQDALQELQGTVASSNADMRDNRLVGTLNMSFIAAHRRFLAGMQKRSTELMQRIVLATRAVDEARNLLAEAAKQRKAIEKLREKQLERWKEDQAKREAALLDEAGMQLAFENLTELGSDLPS